MNIINLLNQKLDFTKYKTTNNNIYIKAKHKKEFVIIFYLILKSFGCELLFSLNNTEDDFMFRLTKNTNKCLNNKSEQMDKQKLVWFSFNDENKIYKERGRKYYIYAYGL